MGLSTKLLFAISILTDNCCSSYYKQNKLPDEKEICDSKFNYKNLELKSDLAQVVTYGLTAYEWNGKSDFSCVLHIKAPPKMGIVAVVQEMSLRKDPKVPNCTDFIQFRHSKETALEKVLNLNLSKKGSWERQICGQMDALKEPIEPTNKTQIANHAFVDSEGYIEVKMFVSRKRVKPEEKIYFKIVFTAFQDCRNETGELRACSSDMCLHKAFFNDKIVNCPLLKCVDEVCTPYDNEEESTDKVMSTVIASAAILSVMVSFLVFLGCILLCRYLELCWMGRSTGVLDRGTELSQVEPSAPPETSSPDKDLPPSYETLFPER